jgi:hypothetical protein
VEKTGEHRIFARKAKSPASGATTLNPAAATLAGRRKQSFDRGRIEDFLAISAPRRPGDRGPQKEATRHRPSLCVLADVENWS